MEIKKSSWHYKFNNIFDTAKKEKVCPLIEYVD